MAQKIIPVAKRIVEFKESDLRLNPTIVHLDEKLVSEEAWNQFAQDALHIVNGWDIVQYAEEYPIVRYQCDEEKSCYLDPDFCLNSFIEQITVSAGMYGKKVSMGSGRVSCNNTDGDIAVYYTDHAGINYAVIQHDIYMFLLRKPELVVSTEGMLIFYTEDKILATFDCFHYYWIHHRINMISKVIKRIEVHEDYSIIILEDKEKGEQKFSLKFKIQMTEHQCICPEIIPL